MSNPRDANALRRMRAVLKGSCTRIKNYVDSVNVSDVTPPVLAALEVRKVKLEQQWIEYNNIQTELEALEEDNDRDVFETAFYELATKLQILMSSAINNPRGSDVGTRPTANLQEESSNAVRLPKLDLPQFTGKYEDWFAFHDTFHAVIHRNNSLSDVQKFQYLRASLTNEAAEVICSLELSNQNYVIAWNLLKERYDDPQVLVQTHIKAIFELPTVYKENANELRQIADGTARHIRALQALRRPAETWDDLIIYILNSKLDLTTAVQWRTSLKEKQIPLLDAVGKSGSPSASQGRANARKQGSHAATVRSQCNFCKEDHLIYYCTGFLKLPIPERISRIRKLKLCVNCLRNTNHSAAACKSSKCKKCGESHNTLLHLQSKGKDVAISSGAPSELPKTDSESSSVVTCASTSCSGGILLSTALVYVLDRYGNRHKCKALLDNGSQINLISSSFFNKLHLPTQAANITVTGINGIASNANRIVQLTMQSRTNDYSADIKCIVTERVTERLPARSINRSFIQIPSSIKLADPDFHVSSEIELLLGVDLFWEIICHDKIEMSPGHPIIQKTRLGWILAGSFTKVSKEKTRVNVCHASTTNEDLLEQISRFWRLEEITNPSHALTIEETECEIHFEQNVERNPEGRIVVKLPVKDNKIKLMGETRSIAARRFYKLEKRFDHQPYLKTDYKGFIHEYLNLKHMKLVESEEPTNSELPTYYLPHHCVIKPDSVSTKLRVVFDGSCKSSSDISLNDCLKTGPVIQPDLISILLRFRIFSFVFTADIKKMYRQVLINPSQTQLQRIFWRDEPSDPLQVFELNTVTYGTTSASYLATRALKYLADLYVGDYPLAAQCISRDFYVDDVLSGGGSIEECIKLRDELIQLLDKGGFQLDKWASNSNRILLGLDGTSQIEIPFDRTVDHKILGNIWSPSDDSLRYHIEIPNHSTRITKRQMLSEIARLFDPLGMIGPVLIVPKLLMQELWQQGVQWDETILPPILFKWQLFRSELCHLNNLNIKRCVKFNDALQHVQLHGFCDASQRAYGACVYIRSNLGNGKFQTNLLCSKTRVAPLKVVSLPRLELCGALLLAQLVSKVRESTGLSDIKQFLWSDSTITLNWIASTSRKWSVFVANRIGEIQRMTKISDWRHVSSQRNPADMLSRGMNPKELISCKTWWHGPSYLELEESEWPLEDTIPKILDSELPELRKAVISLTTTRTPLIDSLLNKFSNPNKICRIVAYCLRFINFHSRNSYTSTTITHQEVSAALLLICREVQHNIFCREIECLKNNQPLKAHSHLLSLSPFLDDKELIRVGGRLKNSELPYNMRHPILLPKHILTELIIRDEHVRNLHSGLQGTIAAVRQMFWPLGVRSITRKIIRKCVTCFKCKPINSEAIMGTLPTSRITPSRPFTKCGVDYAGPINIREGKRRNARHSKAYVCIFVCFSTKAIHIELVSDLTADAFIAALKRFVSRRGKPSSIFSDNGSNFVGAARQLSEFYEFIQKPDLKTRVYDFSRDSKISWEFIPPNAPHFGGLWEAGVKSIKFHLHRIVGTVALTFEELQTVLCEIEAILNSRPLIPLSTDANDLDYISPGHFLVGGTLNGLPCHDLTDVNTNRLLRWQLVEQLRQYFWKRWSYEYLNQLQQRQKWTTSKGPQLKIGQLAIIKQPGLAPLRWLLARVEKVHTGSDGIARSATLRTATGTLVRPLSRLAILPIDD